MIADPKMRSASCHVLLVAILIIGFSTPLRAYGPLGHEIVGAIADERLANTATAAKIRGLIDGLSLEKAAVIADEIKGWDKKGVDDSKAFHFSAHPKIDWQLRDFWRANQPTHNPGPTMPSHHWFHYTDVPVVRVEKYAEGQAGRDKWDVVNWQIAGNVAPRNYAEVWADEILPIAREAHERLQFTDVHAQQEEDRIVAAGEAREKASPDHTSYRAWATNVVREELHKAGWRLADLLEKTLW